MQLGCIADDYTGASDLANTLAKAGLATVQYLGIPSLGAAASSDAAVISLKIRSVAPAEAVRQALEALHWLRSQGASQILYKICSTFDSTPAGNIGPVSEALAAALGARGIAVCPAFPAAGRTVYRGHLFVGDRLLSESGLERHPVNPMTDPDIRRWLTLQCSFEAGLVGHPTVARGAAAIRAALDDGPLLSIVDAIHDDDRAAIGRIGGNPVRHEPASGEPA